MSAVGVGGVDRVQHPLGGTPFRKVIPELENRRECGSWTQEESWISGFQIRLRPSNMGNIEV